jgi:branched-chain amino acid transport system permease protein
MLGAFARRHRLGPVEVLPWIVAIVAYFAFPNYLALLSQILATIVFALSSTSCSAMPALSHSATPPSSVPAPTLQAAGGERLGRALTGLLAAAIAAGSLGLFSGQSF